MNTSERLKVLVALVMLGSAVWLLHGFIGGSRGVSDQAFFYDLSEKRLFAAPRDAVPPIPGLNNSEEDAVRAIVISTNGNPADMAARTIAYLEKYSPELKAQMLKARKDAGALAMSRGEALHHRWVKRLSDTEWFPMDSPMGERIVTDWALPGPNGATPAVCSP